MPVVPTRTPTPKPKTTISGSMGSLNVQPAFDGVRSRPAAVTARARQSARRAADRVVALIVKWVIGQVVLGDVVPDILVRPRRQRVELPDTPALVALDLLRVRARRSLLAADAGDPGLHTGQRRLQRRDLRSRDAAAVIAARPGGFRIRGVEDL